MEENGKDVLFGKRMFGGFSRRDVIRYIDSLQKQNMTAVQGGEDALRRACAQVRELARELEDANETIASLEAKVRELEQAQAKPEPAPSVKTTAPKTPSASASQTADKTKKAAPSSGKKRGATGFFK
jgi:hypothetical protein